MTPTKVRSAAYRARKKVRDSDALARLERYERALMQIQAAGELAAFMSEDPFEVEMWEKIRDIAGYTLADKRKTPPISGCSGVLSSPL